MTPAYIQWLSGLKNRIQSAQIKAALKVNAELIALYWELGSEISQKEKEAQWGDKLIPQLSKDLLGAFPEMKGFSRSNLYYIKKWFLFYSSKSPFVQQLVGQMQQFDSQVHEISQQPVAQKQIVQQVVGQIPTLFTAVPWGHHLQIITKCKIIEEALFYLSETAAHGWSRNVLVHQIESSLYKRKGSAVTNSASLSFVQTAFNLMY
ncbi:MAG: DUF1016 family protein [Sphingobacteriales bacterium]|nr:MAG: DUF1016 family protein [Sphingobacteriales bacterium]